MHQSAPLQIDATLAIRAMPGFPDWFMEFWREALDELIEIDAGWEPELFFFGHRVHDVWYVNVITETLTIDATNCDDVPDRVDDTGGMWQAVLDGDQVVDGRRPVRFDISGRE